MRKLIASIILLTSSVVFAQTDLTLYQLTNVPGSNMLNPGFRPEANLVIGFPVLTSLGVNIHNSGFELRDLVGIDVDNPNQAIQDIANSMDGKDHISFNLRTDLIYAGFGVGNGYVSLGAGTYTFVNFDYPADLLRFLWPSSEDFSEVSFNLKETDYEALNSSFYHLGYQHNLLENKLSVGVRAKFFTGIQHAYIERFNGSINGQADRMIVNTDVLIRTGGVASLVDQNDLSIPGLLFPNNTGFAFDFGATYAITSRWEISASVVNLGSITFNENLRQYVSNGTYEFTGLEYDPSQGDLSTDRLENDLDSIFGVVEEDGVKYTRSLPTEAYASITHNFNRTHSLSATYHLRSWSGDLFHDAGVSYQGKFGKTFHLVLGYNLINGTYNNISTGFAFNMGAFQWHLMSDNVYGFFYPGRTNTANIRTGFSFRFGRDRLERKMAKLNSEAPPIDPIPQQNEDQ
jgi:hypothetical protein